VAGVFLIFVSSNGHIRRDFPVNGRGVYRNNMIYIVIL